LAEGMSTTALAQSTPDSRVALDVTGGYQTSLTRFSQSVTFEQYSEPGSLTSTYTVKRRPAADAGLAMRVWRTFGVGISGSYFHDSGSTQVNALVPNPFVFGQPRQVNGSAGVSHTEIGMHVVCQGGNGFAHGVRVRLGAPVHREPAQGEGAREPRRRSQQSPRHVRLLADTGAAADSSIAELPVGSLAQAEHGCAETVRLRRSPTCVTPYRLARLLDVRDGGLSHEHR